MLEVEDRPSASRPRTHCGCCSRSSSNTPLADYRQVTLDPRSLYPQSVTQNSSRFCSVNERGDLAEPVQTVLSGELERLLGGKELTAFNQDFIDANPNSLEHRTVGRSPSIRLLLSFLLTFFL